MNYEIDSASRVFVSVSVVFMASVFSLETLEF
jgi:hypothetical protein